jgi:eukaryotic-like serine/threonine-protein kinase
MTQSANDSKIAVGTILVGKYKVSGEIGRGGMAAVYEAEHLALQKRVAIKVLAAELTASKVVSERFFREARAAASVRSPHIVDVYDSGRLEDGRPFIVMELLVGESLYDRMARVRILSNADTARIMGDCAKGLAKAHAASIVHRDLKPENIFVLRGEDGVEYAKLLDFGLAKFYSPVQGDEKAARLTREGAVFGTPAYMSPEQVRGQGTVDHRADLWALGCIAYECLTGRPVWNMDQGVAMIFASIATAPLPIPSQVYAGIPLSFDDWFRKALAREPEHRFQNAKELADALAMALSAPDPGVSGPLLLPNYPPSNRELSGAGPVSSARLASSGAANADGLPPSSQPFSMQPPTNNNPPGYGGSASGTGRFPASAGPIADLAGAEYNRGRGSGVRTVISALLLLGAAAAAGGAWLKFLGPQVTTPIVVAPPVTVPLAESSASSAPLVDEPKWMHTFAEGQALFSHGDVVGAQKKFREAQDNGGGGAARAMFEQAKAASEGHGSCRIGALSHPRLGIPGGANRPAMLPMGARTLVVWTDDHEQAGREHAYSVLVDEFGTPRSAVRDITPEANFVVRPVLYMASDKPVVFYWDKSGSEAGIRGRMLDTEGRISGASLPLGAARAGNFWPSVQPAGNGFAVLWQDDRDGNDDLFFRRFSSALVPESTELRLTDFNPQRGHRAAVSYPSFALASDALVASYRFERDKDRSLILMRLSLGAPELRNGLDEKTQAGRADRELGQSSVVSTDHPDVPSVACGKEGCFVGWHIEGGGASIASFDPVKGTVLWRKQFVRKGGRPALAAGPDGDVAVAFYEEGKVKLASVSRDGVAQFSTFARVAGDPARPYLSAGKSRGEWYVGWLDVEGVGTPQAHTEPFVARLSCPR